MTARSPSMPVNAPVQQRQPSINVNHTNSSAAPTPVRSSSNSFPRPTSNVQSLASSRAPSPAPSDPSGYSDNDGMIDCEDDEQLYVDNSGSRALSVVQHSRSQQQSTRPQSFSAAPTSLSPSADSDFSHRSPSAFVDGYAWFARTEESPKMAYDKLLYEGADITIYSMALLKVDTDASPVTLPNNEQHFLFWVSSETFESPHRLTRMFDVQATEEQNTWKLYLPFDDDSYSIIVQNLRFAFAALWYSHRNWEEGASQVLRNMNLVWQPRDLPNCLLGESHAANDEENLKDLAVLTCSFDNEWKFSVAILCAKWKHFTVLPRYRDAHPLLLLLQKIITDVDLFYQTPAENERIMNQTIVSPAQSRRRTTYNRHNDSTLDEFRRETEAQKQQEVFDHADPNTPAPRHATTLDDNASSRPVAPLAGNPPAPQNVPPELAVTPAEEENFGVCLLRMPRDEAYADPPALLKEINPADTLQGPNKDIITAFFTAIRTGKIVHHRLPNSATCHLIRSRDSLVQQLLPQFKPASPELLKDVATVTRTIPAGGKIPYFSIVFSSTPASIATLVHLLDLVVRRQLHASHNHSIDSLIAIANSFEWPQAIIAELSELISLSGPSHLFHSLTPSGLSLFHVSFFTSKFRIPDINSQVQLAAPPPFAASSAKRLNNMHRAKQNQNP